ncbi:MAG: phosphoserine transaminase [Alphaproteobacteria bacterium]|nr:phosphoserine transaminase [Alphaproteobacteria bacterium]
MKPTIRPENPRFGSGPTTKRPGWSATSLNGEALGRSHRAAIGKSRLNEVLERSRSLLGVPEDHRVAIVPASDTGAFEMAMWNILGARGVDVLAWESFGAGWLTDIEKQLKLDDVHVHKADYGHLPDLAEVNPDHDVVFTWNGTTSGVRVPHGEWIAADRQGLTLCDATSAVFAMALPWDKLDVTTYSWQKVLGGEAQHGILVLSPAAVERLESYSPPWPLPKIFRLTKGGALIEGVFRGETINTPSMLAVEDALDGLRWADNIGGLDALIARTDSNFQAIESWVEKTAWVDFLAAEPATRSTTSICLQIIDPLITSLPIERQGALIKDLTSRLAEEGVAYDIAGYRDAPPGLRIWGGSTVETADIEALLPWLNWAFDEACRCAV